MSEKKLAPIVDGREAVRFTQNEAKTFDCLTNAELPEWQRQFSQWAWYTQTPIAVWLPYIEASKPTALKLIHGDPVRLENEVIAQVVKMTRVLEHLFNQGVLPTSDKKAISGIVKVGKEVIDWHDFYAAFQAQQQQSTEGV